MNRFNEQAYRVVQDAVKAIKEGRPRPESVAPDFWDLLKKSLEKHV